MNDEVKFMFNLLALFVFVSQMVLLWIIRYLDLKITKMELDFAYADSEDYFRLKNEENYGTLRIEDCYVLEETRKSYKLYMRSQGKIKYIPKIVVVDSDLPIVIGYVKNTLTIKEWYAEKFGIVKYGESDNGEVVS